MATVPELETRTVPVTVTYLVEEVLRTTRERSLTTQHWFMQEAQAAIKQDLMVIQTEAKNRGLVI